MLRLGSHFDFSFGSVLTQRRLQHLGGFYGTSLSEVITFYWKGSTKSTIKQYTNKLCFHVHIEG